MMTDFNLVVVEGRLTRDAEIKYSKSGVSIHAPREGSDRKIQGILYTYTPIYATMPFVDLFIFPISPLFDVKKIFIYAKLLAFLCSLLVRKYSFPIISKNSKIKKMRLK